MNWTGGNLQRHSNRAGGNNAFVNKQKQHFARARANLSKPAASTPPTFKPSFLQQDSASGKRPDVDWSTMPPGRRQRKLDEYESVAPVVQRLSGLVTEDFRPKQHVSKRRTNTRACNNHLRDIGSGINSKSLSFGRADSEHGQYGPYPINKERRFDGHAGIASAETLSRSLKEKDSKSKPKDAELEEKRHEILGKRDWVGLHRGKPIRAQDHTETPKDQIGKRRKLNPQDDVRRQGAKCRKRVPSIREGQFTTIQKGDSADLVGDIRVKFGSAALMSQSTSQKSDGRGLSFKVPSASTESMPWDEPIYSKADNSDFVLLPDEDDIPSDHAAQPDTKAEGLSSRIQEFDSATQTWQRADLKRRSLSTMQDWNEQARAPTNRPARSLNSERGEAAQNTTLLAYTTDVGIAVQPALEEHSGQYTSSLTIAVAPTQGKVFPPYHSSEQAESGLGIARTEPIEARVKTRCEGEAIGDGDDMIWREFIQLPDDDNAGFSNTLSSARDAVDPSRHTLTSHRNDQSDFKLRAGCLTSFLSLHHAELHEEQRWKEDDEATRKASLKKSKPPVSTDDELWRSFVFGDKLDSPRSSRESTENADPLALSQTSKISKVANVSTMSSPFSRDVVNLSLRDNLVSSEVNVSETNWATVGSERLSFPPVTPSQTDIGASKSNSATKGSISRSPLMSSSPDPIQSQVSAHFVVEGGNMRKRRRAAKQRNRQISRGLVGESNLSLDELAG